MGVYDDESDLQENVMALQMVFCCWTWNCGVFSMNILVKYDQRPTRYKSIQIFHQVFLFGKRNKNLKFLFAERRHFWRDQDLVSLCSGAFRKWHFYFAKFQIKATSLSYFCSNYCTSKFMDRSPAQNSEFRSRHKIHFRLQNSKYYRKITSTW